MRTPLREEQQDIWLPTKAVAALMRLSGRAVRKAVAAAVKGTRPWRGTRLVVRQAPGCPENAPRHEILLASLPDYVQAKYAHSSPSAARCEGAKAQWKGFEAAPAGVQSKARANLDVVVAYYELERAGVPKGKICARLREKFGKGTSVANISRLLNRIRGHARSDWLPLLAPRWCGKPPYSAFTEAAWLEIRAEWLQLSRPALAPITKRVRLKGRPLGWKIPSDSTIHARLNALPHWELVLGREGAEALSRLYPAQERDYESLSVHELWVSDGRKADLFVRWEDGTINRPVVVSWLDVRTRVCVAHRVGKTEDGNLIRLTFKDGAETTQAVPRATLFDNGPGYAAKSLSGGALYRNRFKIRDEDPLGILPALGIEITWAMPGHGQSKPIESWHRMLAEMDKRSEFAGAYCGNNPDAKPEGFDPKKAVPIGLYREVLQQEISAYHQRAHRGHGMGNKSPRAIYEELLQHTVVRQPTKEQLRLCLLAAESVKLRADGVRICGNRYWDERLADLPRKSYTVRCDPADARRPVAVFDRERFLCEAYLIDAVGFRDRAAAREHARQRSKFIRAKKDQSRAEAGMAAAARWTPGAQEAPQAADALPAPKVVAPLRPRISTATTAAPDSDSVLAMEDWEVTRRILAVRRRRAGYNEI